MEAQDVIGSFTALMAADDDLANGFVIAAVYCRAVRTGTSPRDVVEALFRSLPDDQNWPGLRDALLHTWDGGQPA